MDLKKAIEKIRKLLALSESENEHEAFLAANKARCLLEKHNLSLLDIKQEKIDAKAEEDVFLSCGRVLIWRKLLIFRLSKIFDLEYFWAGKNHSVVGLPQDISVFNFTYIFLEREINRISKNISRASRNSFKLGAVTRVCEKLKDIKESEKKQDKNKNALVIAKDKIVSEYMQTLGPIRTCPISISRDSFYYDGYCAADSVNLSRPVEKKFSCDFALAAN